MEHIVPKLIQKDCFIPILLSVNGIYCSEIGHQEQVLDFIVPILYLLMEHFVPKVVFRTFLFRGSICVWNIMFPNSSVRIKVKTVLFRFMCPLTMYCVPELKNARTGLLGQVWVVSHCHEFYTIVMSVGKQGHVLAS